MKRRDFLLTAAAAAMSPAFAQQGSPVADVTGQRRYLRWTMFSRHLQCLTTQDESRRRPYDTGVIIGEGAAEGGFGAINLTVRRDGHVEPEMVATNLEPMLRGIRSTGTHCDHVTSSILNLQSDYADDILTAAADNGVRYYRWGPFRYDYSPTAYGKAFVSQLDEVRRETAQLAAFNARLGLTALYHTYSGNTIGASLWDLVRVLDGLDPDAVGINFDIGHMFSEGVRSWVNDLRYAMPYVRGASLKDATYVADEDGKAKREFMAAGEGSVDWVEYFRQLLEGGFSGPAESHLEFEFAGADLLWSTWWLRSRGDIVTRRQLTGVMSSELAAYRRFAIEAGWPRQNLV